VKELTFLFFPIYDDLPQISDKYLQYTYWPSQT